MASVDSLSDGELRHKLAEYGFPVGPVTETSRKVLCKKLKHLMVQAGRSSDVSTTDKWRRSSSRFSSGEEESENEDAKSRLNSSMPPPSSDFKSLRPKSTSKTQYAISPGRLGRRKEINLRSDLFDSPKTSTPESEPNKIKRSRYSAPPNPQGSSGTRRSPSRSASSKSFKDGFDTGSDSDIDSQKWKSYTGRTLSSDSPASSPSSSYTSSFVSRLSVRPKQKSDDDGGGDSSSVNTLLGFRKSYQSTSNTASTSDNWYTSRNTSAPFQSSFVQRLSGLSTSTSSGAGSSPSIYDVKENDEVNVTPNGLFSPSRLTNQSRSDISQEFKTAEDQGRFGCNSQIISMILLAIVALFFSCLGIMYVTVKSRDGVTFAMEDRANSFPICPSDTDYIDGHVNTNEICIEKSDVLPAIKMAKILHPQLYERAVAHQCAGAQTSIITHHQAVKFLMGKVNEKQLLGQYFEGYLRALKVLLISNPHWGIMVIDTATGASSEDKVHHHQLIDSGALVVPDPVLPMFCYLKIRLMGMLPLVLIFATGLIVIYVVKRYIQYYVRHRERNKLAIYNLVEQIVDILIRYQKDSPYTRPVFVPVNHVRDELIKLADRERLAPLWEQVVKYIRKHESRIRCETQTVEGELCDVWRWIPTGLVPSPPVAPVSSRKAAPLPSVRRSNKIWQGQAFDTMSGSPNSLQCSPTACLKIRNMFEPEIDNDPE